MTERLNIYKCSVCGNTVQVLLSGMGELVCCGEPMDLLMPHTSDNSELKDKHLPVFTDNGDNHKLIQLGSELHPMSEEHYIQFIETISDDKNNLHIKYLKPNDIPTMTLNNSDNNVTAKAYCNIHGLWEAKND